MSSGAIPADLYAEEALFQLAHVVDLQQTLDIKHHANLHEGVQFLDAGWLVGRHPSDRTVYAYMSAEGLLHAGMTVLLARYCPAWTARIWEATTISIEGKTIAHNVHTGMQLRF